MLTADLILLINRKTPLENPIGKSRGHHNEFIFWDLMSFLQYSITKVWGFYANLCCYYMAQTNKSGCSKQKQKQSDYM